MTKQLINKALFAQLESSGKEVEYIEKNGKVIGATSINPLQRLVENQTITESQHASLIKYQIDVAMSELTNHAHMSWSSEAHSVEKKDFSDIQDRKSQASKNVVRVQMLLQHEENKEANKQILRKSRIKTLKLAQITKYLIEKEIKFFLVRTGLRIQDAELKRRTQIIATIIHNYYAN